MAGIFPAMNPTELSLSVLVKRHGVGGYWAFFHALLILTSLAPKACLAESRLYTEHSSQNPSREAMVRLKLVKIQAHRDPPEVAIRMYPSELRIQ
ncbi:MAG: hypothetical protein ACYYK0_00940 [Candidatus Eutrophobiaceae bacterium]